MAFWRWFRAARRQNIHSNDPKKTAGVWLCEDPLHCYKRLLESINFASREAAFLARSLQVLLSTWNPARRIYGKDDLQIGKKMSNRISWIHFTPWELSRPAEVADVLRSYFQGFSFPPNAADLLLRDFKRDWHHPHTQKLLPSCCKVVIYRDVARATDKKNLKDCVKLVYEKDLKVTEVEAEFTRLADCFSDRLFEATRGGAGGARGGWWQQQLKYLRHFRQRPVQSTTQSKVKPGSVDEAAGGDNFSRVVASQKNPAVTHGC